MTYILEISEKRTKTVKVDGLSYKEAVQKANEMYDNGEINFNDKEGEALMTEKEVHVIELDDVKV